MCATKSIYELLVIMISSLLNKNKNPIIIYNIYRNISTYILLLHATWAENYYYLLLNANNNNNNFLRARCGSAPLRSKCSARCCARCTPGFARTRGAPPKLSSAASTHPHDARLAVESVASTSCEWKEGGNAACSALVNCPTVQEAAKWDSPHCNR